MKGYKTSFTAGDGMLTVVVDRDEGGAPVARFSWVATDTDGALGELAAALGAIGGYRERRQRCPVTARDFPGLYEAQGQARKACLLLRDALVQIDQVDQPAPSREWQLYALQLRNVAALAQACALELAACAGVVSAAHEADTSGLLDEDGE